LVRKESRRALARLRLRRAHNRDKASLDIFWLRDESLEDSGDLPHPEVLAQEIVEDLEAALAQFAEIAADLGGEATKETT
jgi:type I restriction enzyme M protein